MPLDRNYLVGIISIVIGIIGSVIAYFSYLLTRESELARKIDSVLKLLPTCNFDTEKEKKVGELLLLAKKKLDIDGNYSEASHLLNSISSDMWICKPTLEAHAQSMLYTILGILVIFGIIMIISHYRET